MPPNRHRRRRGRGAPLVVLAVILAAVAAVAAALATRTGPSGTTSTSTTGGSSTTTVAPTTQPALTAVGTYDVGSTTLSVTAPTQLTGAAGPTLAVEVLFPATGPTATPDRTKGPFALLAFSQGFGVAPAAYSPLLDAWASAGFVVAAPTYPHTDIGAPTGLDETDIVNHPADLGAVLKAVASAGSDAQSPLYGMIRTDAVGLVGQSDGGNVSLAAVSNPCCRLEGVKAAAILSGAEQTYFQGSYFQEPSPPLLVVQGSTDTINPPMCSVQIYDEAPQPKWYLDLLGASHLVAYTAVNPYETVVAAVTTEFFEAQLDGLTRGTSAMATDGNVSGVSTLTSGPSAPPAAGSCPGAPTNG